MKQTALTVHPVSLHLPADADELAAPEQSHEAEHHQPRLQVHVVPGGHARAAGHGRQAQASHWKTTRDDCNSYKLLLTVCCGEVVQGDEDGWAEEREEQGGDPLQPPGPRLLPGNLCLCLHLLVL